MASRASNSPAAAGAVEHLSLAPPAIHPDRILRIQRYSDLSRVRPVIRQAAEAMAAVAAQLSEPAVAFRHVPVRGLHDDVLEMEGGARLHCKAFGRQLQGCTEIVPFVLSVGAAIPERVIDLVDAGDLLEGLLLETAGWLAIEDATRQFKTGLRERQLARKCRITSRMGPGYSYKIGQQMYDWRLEEQPVLFGLFGGAALPVTLMSSCAMTPKMSRSGLYGVAPLQPASRIARIGGRTVPEST